MIQEEKVLPIHSFLAIVGKSIRRVVLETGFLSLLDEEIACIDLKLSTQSIKFFFNPAKNAESKTNTIVGENLSFVLGDCCVFESAEESGPLGSAVFIRFNGTAEYPLKIMTSIVGLPPVFVYEGAECLVLASDLRLFMKVLNLQMEFDAQGIYDFCRIGHPIDGRTLFKNIRLLPSGYSLRLRSNGQLSLKNEWSLPKIEALRNWNGLCEDTGRLFWKCSQKYEPEEQFFVLDGRA